MLTSFAVFSSSRHNREAIIKRGRTDDLWTIVTNTPSKVDDENGYVNILDVRMIMQAAAGRIEI